MEDCARPHLGSGVMPGFSGATILTVWLVLAPAYLREVCRLLTPLLRYELRLPILGQDLDWWRESRAWARAPAPHVPCLCPSLRWPDGRHPDSVREERGRSKTIPVAQSILWRGHEGPARLDSLPYRSL